MKSVYKFIVFFYVFLIIIFIFSFTTKTFAAWDISTASYSGISVSTSPATNPVGMFFREDGTKVYIANFGDTKIYQFSLGTAWDITTLSYDSKSFNTSAQGSPDDVALSEDGTKMFVLSFYDYTVRQYTLGTAWDVSTATYDSVLLSLGSANHYDFHIKRDGAKVFSLNDYNNRVQQYTLSTPWSLSSQSAGTNYSYPSLSDGQELMFSMGDDGLNMYIGGSTNDRIHWFTLSSAWDTSTASYSGSYLSVNAQDTSPRKFNFNPSGTRMYVLGDTNNKIFQYNLGDSTNPTLSTVSPLDNSVDVLIGSNLTLTFDEDVDVETGNILIKRTDDDSTFATIDVTGGQVTGTGTDVITINPTVDFAYGTQYYIQIATTAFDDLNGNSYAGITDTTSWSFTTEQAVSSGGSNPILPTTICKVSDYFVEEGDEVNFSVEVFTDSSSLEYDFEWTKILDGDDETESHVFDDTGIYDVRGLVEDSFGNTAVVNCGSIKVSEKEKTYKDSKNNNDKKTEDNSVEKIETPQNVETKKMIERDLDLGMSGDDVKYLQNLLIDQNKGKFAEALSEIGATGYFGSYTRNALAEYQSISNIYPSVGYFGSITRAQMKSFGLAVLWW